MGEDKFLKLNNNKTKFPKVFETATSDMKMMQVCKLTLFTVLVVHVRVTSSSGMGPGPTVYTPFVPEAPTDDALFHKNACKSRVKKYGVGDKMWEMYEQLEKQEAQSTTIETPAKGKAFYASYYLTELDNIVDLATNLMNGGSKLEAIQKRVKPLIITWLKQHYVPAGDLSRRREVLHALREVAFYNQLSADCLEKIKQLKRSTEKKYSAEKKYPVMTPAEEMEMRTSMQQMEQTEADANLKPKKRMNITKVEDDSSSPNDYSDDSYTDEGLLISTMSSHQNRPCGSTAGSKKPANSRANTASSSKSRPQRTSTITKKRAVNTCNNATDLGKRFARQKEHMKNTDGLVGSTKGMKLKGKGMGRVQRRKCDRVNLKNMKKSKKKAGKHLTKGRRKQIRKKAKARTHEQLNLHRGSMTAGKSIPGRRGSNLPRHS